MIFAGSSDARPDTIKASLRGWLIWLVAALFYLYKFFVRVAPSTMEPELQKAFHLTAAGLGAAMGISYTIYAPAALIVALDCFLEVLGHLLPPR